MEPSIVPESSVKASLSGAYSPSWSAFGGVNIDLRRSILTDFVCLLRALGCDGPSSVGELSKTSRYQKPRTRQEQKKRHPGRLYITSAAWAPIPRQEWMWCAERAFVWFLPLSCIMYDLPVRPRWSVQIDRYISTGPPSACVCLSAHPPLC